MKDRRDLLPDPDAMASARCDGTRWPAPALLSTYIQLGRRLRGSAVRHATARVCQAVGDGVGAIVGRLAAWHERARMRRHLVQMDDRLLRDIGLSRLDAKREINKPFWRE